MASFRFIHAADIHLDSPLHGLSRYDGVPANEVRGATRAAFDNLIERALAERVDFLIIAGDLFDGDWKDMGTGLYFARAMARLSKAGIAVFLLAGNHDAASVLTKSLPWAEGVHIFGARKPETFRLQALGVALHGQSFINAHVTDNLAAAYPPPLANMVNIGVLHTALDGYACHARYAPCSASQLAAKGYDYWALGHVHDFEVVLSDPAIVFPGNLQGRNIRETGPKGAVLVEVLDNAIARITPIVLDVVRWARVEADCSDLTEASELHNAVRIQLASAHSREADGRPLIIRLSLAGTTDLDATLRDGQAALREEIRALAAAVSDDLWLEKLVIETQPLARTAAPATVGEDFWALLDEARRDPDLAKALADDLTIFVNALPAAEGGASAERDLQAAARSGAWDALLDAAAAALPARLTAAS